MIGCSVERGVVAQCMCEHVCVCVCISLCLCVCVSVCINMCLCVCAYVCECVCAATQADLVVMFGAVCDFRLDYGRSLSRKSKVVSINRNPALATLNSGAVHSLRGCLRIVSSMAL